MVNLYHGVFLRNVNAWGVPKRLEATNLEERSC